jgi:soluble lytic murein transglycosylase
MKKHFITLGVLFFLVTLATACSFSNPDEVVEKLIPTAILPSLTPSPVPSPTPSPTPLPEVRIDRGDFALLTGDYQKAITEFSLAKSSSDEVNIQAVSDLGTSHALIKQSNCPGSLKLSALWMDNEEILPNLRAKANYLQAICLANQNEFILSGQAYAKYVEIYPGYLDGYMLEKSADMLIQASDYSAAIETYLQAVSFLNGSDLDRVKTKIGKAYVTQMDHTNAIRIFMEVHDSSPNEYTRAQMNLLAGQSYLALGLPEQAYARFQESVENYPRAYDSYSGLITLVDVGIPVNDFYRGLVDFYAQQYGVAIDAFARYLSATPDHNGSAHYYIGLSWRALDEPEKAINEWRILINDHPDDRFFVDAWEDIAYTQWAYMNRHQDGAETLQDFVKSFPASPSAPQALYDSARILERNNDLVKAAETWARMIDEYPLEDISYQGLFQSGIAYYRLKQFDQSLQVFQRYLLLNSSVSEQSAATFWIAKNYLGLNDSDKARLNFEQSATADPTGYYSERAKEILNNSPLLTSLDTINQEIDLVKERTIAEIWMRQTFNLPAETNFVELNSFTSNPDFIQAMTFWDLGLYENARNSYELLRNEYENDPLALFRLTNHFVDIGLFRSAILSSRQILELAGMDDMDTFNAPLWFNHVRFGLYYSDIVNIYADQYNFDPLLIFSVIRQESFFEGFVSSSVGARGVMQIMPATGTEINSFLSWPQNYSVDDLYQPVINIRYGVSYLDRMRNYFNGDLFAALAAYNAGPGNVLNWENMAENDPDLFMEVIPYEETRRYLKQIYEFFKVYQYFYQERIVAQ